MLFQLRKETKKKYPDAFLFFKILFLTIKTKSLKNHNFNETNSLFLLCNENLSTMVLNKKERCSQGRPYKQTDKPKDALIIQIEVKFIQVM